MYCGFRQSGNRKLTSVSKVWMPEVLQRLLHKHDEYIFQRFVTEMWRKGFHCDYLLDVQAITIPVYDNVYKLACAMTCGRLARYDCRMGNVRSCCVPEVHRNLGNGKLLPNSGPLVESTCL